VQYIDVNLTSAVDFGAICIAALSAGSCASIGALPQQADGFADLNADTLSWGYNLGLLYELSNATRIGLSYRSEIEHTVKGEADFDVPATGSFAVAAGTFVDTDLKATVTLPANASLSLYHDLNTKLALLADATWTGWSSFDELRIRFDNPLQPDNVTTESWNDNWRFSLGAIYKLNNQWLLRGGLAYDQTPIPNSKRRTARIPGNDRKWVSLGITWFYNNAFTVDVGYSHLFIPDTDIDNEFESSVPTVTPTLTGTYEASVDILSAQLRWNF
jgi:long-chain fatty acid transport protein